MLKSKDNIFSKNMERMQVASFHTHSGREFYQILGVILRESKQAVRLLNRY